MKIKYILETIRPKGLRDRTEKSFDGLEIVIGRGSSCDLFLSSRLVSFNHAKLKISDGSLFLEVLEAPFETTFINNKPVAKGVLSHGDILKLGDVELKVESGSEVWSLVEVRSLVSNIYNVTKGQLDTREKVKKQLKLLTISERLPSIYFFTLLILTPILIFLLAAPIMGVNERIWESGPLTEAHKFLETDCKSCHEKTFEMVSDKSCRKCHDMGDHVDFLEEHAKFNEKCSSCHREHLDDKSLILSRSILCVNCHANIKEINVESKYPPISDFGQTHPEFELIRLKKQDRGKLKLNHRYHLDSIEMEDAKNGKKRLMVCSDCHTPDSNGEYMKPITYDAHCKSCHNLKMGGAAHMLRIPHVKTNLVRNFLKDPEDFLYEYIDSKPDDLMETAKSSSGRRRGRGRRSKTPPPTPVQKPKLDWVKNNIEKIKKRGGLLGSENEILFSAQGGCIECHELNTRPVGALNSYNSLAAISLWEHDIRLWDRESKEDRAILYGHQDIVNSTSFSLDGTQLVTASNDFTARVWNVSSEGKEQSKEPKIITNSIVFNGHKGPVNDAVFSPKKDLVLTGSEDGLTIIWDVKKQKPLYRLYEQKEPVKKVRFNSDGSLAMALNSRFNVSIWEVGSGELKRILTNSNHQVIDVEFSPVDPKKLAAAFSDGSIRIYDLEDKGSIVNFGSELGEVGKFSRHSLEVTSISYNQDGSKLASVSRDLSAKIWDANTGEILSTLVVLSKKEKNKKKGQRFVSIDFNASGTKVLTGSTDKIVRLWEASSGKLIKEFLGHENVVSKVLFAQKEEYFLTLSDENLAMLWDLKEDSKTSFRHGEAAEIELKIIASVKAKKSNNDNKLSYEHSHELRLPRVLPTNVPDKFFDKGFFGHRKHEYLECNNCHAGAKVSILSSDLLLPSIKPCQTCHEKQGRKLDRCITCHIYHPEGERNFVKGRLKPDLTAKLGYSYIKP